MMFTDLKQQVVGLLVCCVFVSQAFGHSWQTSRADGHAPIGVMGDHTHPKGEWMFSYRLMAMDMAGNRSGTTSKTTAEVLDSYMVAPLDMTMQMHMLGGMFAVSDAVTLMVMVPFINQSMTHENRAAVNFETEASGLGDVQVSGLVSLYQSDQHRVHLNLGLSVPVGSIDKKDDTPLGDDQQLPYPMQLGSGTFDLPLGVTYMGQSKGYSWGTQARGTIRLGENDRDYALGNRYEGTAWVAKKWTDAWSTSVRSTAKLWNNLSGADTALNTAVVPTAETERGGKQLDIGVGLNGLATKGALKGHRLAIEFTLPVYQSLHGTQLETDWQVVLGWQVAI